MNWLQKMEDSKTCVIHKESVRVHEAVQFLQDSSLLRPVVIDYCWEKRKNRRVGGMARKIAFYSFFLFLLVFQITDSVYSQPKGGEEKADITLGKFNFQTRVFESDTPPLKMLEIQIEILNKSRKLIAPANSIRVVVIPKEIKFPEGTSGVKFKPGQEEVTVPVSLPPNTGRLVIFGFSLPEKKPESITFEIQINPPGEENSVVKWEGRD